MVIKIVKCKNENLPKEDKRQMTFKWFPKMSGLRFQKEKMPHTMRA